LGVDILVFNPNYGIYASLKLTFNFRKGGLIEKEYDIAAAPVGPALTTTTTRNPKPETRNPKPETRNPKPETRNLVTL